MKILFSVLNSLFLSACSVFGIMSVEEAGYEVIHDTSQIQVRRYKPMVVVQTEFDADYDGARGKAFNRLFKYISGNNKKQQKISMTAPVFQERTGKTWLMSFVLPSNYAMTTAPFPTDNLVSLKEIPSKKVAVLRYSGFLSEKSVEEKSQALQTWLKEQDYKAISSARSAGFDPPWTIPFLRRNEVHIDIE